MATLCFYEHHYRRLRGRRERYAEVKETKDSGLGSATGYKIPVSSEKVTFADDSSISAYAKDAVMVIQQADIIAGCGNNQFAPKANSTRAETAIILRRFAELVIDEGTARGCLQNGGGQWQHVPLVHHRADNATMPMKCGRCWLDLPPIQA